MGKGSTESNPQTLLNEIIINCSLQRPALSTSPKAKESIFLICSCPSSLLGRIDVYDI